MDAILTRPGDERALIDELGRGVVLAPGLVEAVGEQPRDPAFGLQPLRAAVRAQGASVARLAKAAFDLLAEPLDACDHWTLHAFPVPVVDREDSQLGGRARLVGETLVDLVRRHRRRTSRRLVAPETISLEQAADPTLRLAQVALLSRDDALVAVGAPARLSPLAVDPDPRFPGGVPTIADDRGAPSSAYRKAEEAYARLGLAPAAGERVVDLGGSPGGWTWTALRRGARVLAVDRAPLEPPVSGHALLEERQGDAFKHEPEGPCDWLLCDVIAAPERTLELLDRWLERGWCRRFVVNIKFKGTEGRLAQLEAVRALVARRGATARVKRLVHDKNEVTCFGVTNAQG